MIIARRTHSEAIPRAVERHGLAELVADVEPGDTYILAAGIAVADRRRQRPAREIRVAKGEKVHCARSREVARSSVANCANGKPVASGVERDTATERVSRFEARHINVLPAGIPLADRRCQRAPRETRVCESKQVYRPGSAS